jgi:hypothetical protein
MASACRIAASASRASADLTVFREDTGDYHPNCRFPAIYRHAVPVVSTTREFRHCTKVGFRRKSPAAAQEKIPQSAKSRDSTALDKMRVW